MRVVLISSTRRFIRQFVLYVALTACGAATLVAPPASAHTLKTDGAISGVLHFQPDDAPMSNAPTAYILFLNDSTKHFSMAECNCMVTIKKDGKTVSTAPMRLNSQKIIGGSITFAKAGTYEITLQGSPAKSGAFQPFTLKYLEQVAPNPDTHQPSPIAVGMGVLFVSMIVIAFWIKIRYNSLKGVKK